MGTDNISHQQHGRQVIDWSEYDRLKAEHPEMSQREIAPLLGVSQGTLSKRLAGRQHEQNGIPERHSLMRSAVHSAEPVQTGEELAMLTQRLTALETNLPQRVDALEAWVATLQTRFSASGPSLPPVQSSAVHSAAPRFDDPDDAKAERWNIWIPRGLRKRIEAQADILGVSASRHLQTMLWRALQAEGVRHDA
jgi:hypothetical protein